MTDTHDKVEQSLLPVTQADRDAAADIARKLPIHQNLSLDILEGKCDDFVLVQAFARHRQSSNAAERGGVNGIFDIEPSVGAREPEPSLRRIVRAYYNGHFNAVRAEELTEAYFASLSTTPATAKRPWCETCGEGVAEVLCQTCAKWWHDNAPATAMDEIQRLGQEYDGAVRVCSACDGESKGCTSEYRCLRCEGTGVEPDFVDGLDNRPKADDAAVARAARAALGEWLAWPDVARDGAVPVDNEQAISWLQGLPAKLTTPPTPDRIGKDAVREADEHYTVAMERRPKEIGGVKVGPGLYRIHWKDGGSSLAAIGMCRNGAWWVAPTNWVEPAVAFRIDEDPQGRWSWAGVKALERLDPDTLSATRAQEGALLDEIARLREDVARLEMERALFPAQPVDETERLRAHISDAIDTLDKLAASMREEEADLLAPEIAVAEMTRDQLLAALRHQEGEASRG